jgi:hypothetical protein
VRVRGEVSWPHPHARRSSPAVQASGQGSKVEIARFSRSKPTYTFRIVPSAVDGPSDPADEYDHRVAKLVVDGSISWVEGHGRGGHVMHVLQFVGGLRSLGHDVLLYDQVGAGDSRLRDERETTELVRRFGDVVTRWWDPRRSASIATDGRSLFGMTVPEIEEFARDADAFIALHSGVRVPPWLESVRLRVYVDVDPGFAQFWAEEYGVEETIGEQDLYFTVGSLVGRGAEIPTVGVDWRPLWPPVVLDWWNDEQARTRDRFTTIASLWDGEWRELGGRLWGPKAHELEAFVRLPELAGEPIEVAADEPTADADFAAELNRHGWRLESAAEVAASPEAYRDYILASAGEFGVAKGVYVGTRSGWFSDRSACFLAAGRPVVVQDTGIRDVIPTGDGLFAVADVEEAAAAIRAIRTDYGRHSAAARALAAEYFDAPRSLRPLVDAIECSKNGDMAAGRDAGSGASLRSG